jgi:hypothetical protein
MSDLINNSAPGVYSFTRVQAQAVSASSPIVVGVVFESEKGPVDEPVLITGGSREKFIQMFGAPRPSISSAHECALEVLKANASVYALRVANESNYAGVSIYSTSDYNEGVNVINESTGLSLSKDFFPQQTFFEPAGTTDGVISDVGVVTVILEVKGVNTSGAMAIKFINGGGSADTTVTTPYVTSFVATVAAFRTALSTALNVNFDVTVDIPATENNGVLFIRIRSVYGTELPAFYDFSNGVALDDAQNFARIHSEPKFFDVYAASPGIWGNRVGIRIRNVDYGRQAVKAIDFGAIGGSDTVVFTIDGKEVSINAVATRAASLNAFIAGLQTALGPLNILAKVGEQSWETFMSEGSVGAKASDDTIYIRHRDFGVELSVTVTGTAATVREVIPPSNYSGLFTLEVFLKDDPTAPVESFRVTLHENVDDFGNQTNISYVVNEGPAQSAYIRVRQPVYTLYTEVDFSHLLRMKGFWADGARTAYHINASVLYLGGGDAGNAVTTSDMLVGIEKFRDRDRYPISLLMNAGYTNRDIQKKLAEVAEARRDCFAILDMPSAFQQVNRAKEYVDYELGLNTSAAGIYTPDIQVVSEYSPGGRFLPPSGDVCARIAERQRQITNVGAPAGLEWGRIQRANKARVEYSTSDVGALQDSQINPIILKLGRGYNIWGARTQSRKFGPLSFTSIRLDLNQLERQMVQILDYAVFRANSAPNRFALKQQIDSLLTSYRRSQIIDYHEVTIDDKNNKDYHAANGQLNIDVIVRFVYPAEKIRLVTTVTDTIITFQELQAA